ncbi:MAG: ComEC family competence protein [Ruminococcaceae bacterium]|nr:ComEC family competence protein [Oscillospiraceae bacterium]
MFGILSVLFGIIFAGIFNDLISFCLAIIILIYLFIKYKEKLNFKKVLVFVILFIIGFFYYIVYDFYTLNSVKDINDKDVALNITVLSEPEYDSSVITFNGYVKEYNKKARVTLYDTPYISYYDTIRIKGDIYTLEENYKSRYSQGLYYNVISYDKNSEIISGKGFLKSIYDFKNKVIYILDNTLSFNGAMFLKGVLVGDDDLRTDEFNDSLNKLSLSHIVSVSGMHFSIISMVLIYIMRRLKINRKLSSAIIVIISFFIAVFIGFTPSVIRVLIMTFILSFADLTNREKIMDIYLLLLTALIMLLFNVYYIHNVAFVLSFTSLAGILLFSQKINDKIKFIPRFFKDNISVSASATVLTIPFILYYFRGLPLLSVLANLLIVPLITVVMVYGIILILISLISIKLGYFIGVPLDMILRVCVNLINFMGDIPFGYFKTLSISVYYISIYYTALFFILIKPSGVLKYVISSVLILYILVNLFYPLERAVLPYGYMYVFQGKDSGKSITLYKDKSIFINGSSTEGKYNYNLIENECNSHFDIYVAFNGECIKYIKNKDFTIDKIYVPAQFLTNPYFTDIMDKKAREIIPVNDTISVQIYDFNLTLKPKDEYNISKVSLVANSKEYITVMEDIDEYKYGAKYIVNYYMVEKYLTDKSTLNNFSYDVERIKI